jgi:hypothetical protein
VIAYSGFNLAEGLKKQVYLILRYTYASVPDFEEDLMLLLLKGF